MANLIVYGIYIFFAGMAASILLSFLKKSAKAGNVLMIGSGVVGFLASVAYLSGFSGRELVIFQTGTLFGISFSLNFLSAIFFALVSGISSLVLIYGVEYLRRYRKTYPIEMVRFLSGFFILGMAGVLLAGNVISFLLFWEMMSVASFLLVMSDKTKESARAAFLYFIMTHLGAAAILGGFLILGGGALNFGLGSIGVAAKTLSPEMLAVSLLLFFFGFGSKAGLIPFHIWLPEAHPQAPTNISALMSGLMLKVAVYGFLRIILAISGIPAWFAILVVALGIVSAFFGALHAAVEKDIKKAFAYSSIENMGIIFTMLGVALYILARNSSHEAMILATLLFAYAIFHAINHAIFKTGLFLSSGVIISKVHSKSLEAMGGFAKAMPFFSFVFLVIILGSAALPPLGTFYGEWGFIRSLIQSIWSFNSDAASLIVFMMILPMFALVSGLAIFAMVKIFGISMLGLPRTHWHEDEADKENDKRMVAPIAVLGGLMILMGVFAKNILNALTEGVRQMSAVQTKIAPSIAISSLRVFLFFVLFSMIAVLAYKILAGRDKKEKEREYHTWDCGQPIDAGMEYTATAFASPIRFFFLLYLRRFKQITAEPIVKTNPWFVKKTFALEVVSNWQARVYDPAYKAVLWMAKKVRLIHTGRIQYYLLLILATIIITLLIAI